ncbi:MAG: hypothetical protein ACOYNF_17180 [Rhodoferax sp.]
MKTEQQARVLTPEQRCWHPWLFNGATFFVYWLAITLVFVVSTFAFSVTRFPPGSELPQTRLTVMVVPDPADPNGPPRVLKTNELAKFRVEHPGSSLVMPPCDNTILEPDARRSHYSYRVTYSARDLGSARTEMTVRGETPLNDSPGSFAYVVLRYQVTGTHIQPVAMVRFDPFVTWFSGAFLSFFAAAAIARVLEKWLIDRPLAQGRWRFLPPLNRDWLVTRGIPFRFEPVPPDLNALAADLRAVGATVRHQRDQEALRSTFGHCAVLTVNLRGADKRPAVLEALIDGGYTPIASLLVVLVAPLAGLSVVAMLLLCLLDPFAAWTDFAAWMAGLMLLASASACLGWHWLKRPGISEQGNRLATILADTLIRQGSHSVPPPRWPKLKPPMPKWRRWLPRIFFGLLLLAGLAPFLLAILLGSFR